MLLSLHAKTGIVDVSAWCFFLIFLPKDFHVRTAVGDMRLNPVMPFYLGLRGLGSLHPEACWGCKSPTSGLLKSPQLRRIACGMWSGSESTQV